MSSSRSRWLVAGVLFAVGYIAQLPGIFGDGIERFDEGILFNAVSFLAHGVVPAGDAYQPYGPGYGLLGLPAHWLFGPEATVVRLVYACAPAAVVALAWLWLQPRVGWLAALLVALLALQADVARYALSWACVLAFLIAVDAVLRRCSRPSLAAAFEERPRALAAASALLGLAAWIRLEYAVFPVLWIVVAWVVTRRRPPLVVAAAPLAVAALPWLLVIATGGVRHVRWWLEYALSGFREFRQQPVNGDLPVDWVRAVFGQGDYATVAMELLSYGAGAALVLAVVVNLLLPARRRFIARDDTGLAAFLLCVAAIVIYAQSVRYHSLNGYSAAVLVWAAFAALAWRSRWVRPAVLGVAVVIALPFLDQRVDVAGNLADARDGWRANGQREPIERFSRAPMNEEERASLPALLALWRAHEPHADRVLSILRRNDDTQGNEAFVPWFLDVKPAAWPTTYDPGLADREDVQRDVADALCANRAPLVQANGVYPQPDPRRHASRYLDQFVALNYDAVGAEPLHRLLRHHPGACVRPERVDDTVLRERRLELLSAGDTPAAGALSVLALERSRAARADGSLSDAAIAVLGGYRVEDGELPAGPGRDAVVALRDAQAAPGVFERVAGDEGADPYVRLLAVVGFVRVGRDGSSPEQGAAIVEHARELAEARPDLPQVGEVIPALEPAGAEAFEHYVHAGVRAEWLDRWRFDHYVAGGDVALAVASAAALMPDLRGRPVDQGAVLVKLADAYARAGQGDCANAALRTADALPGVDPGAVERVPGECPGLPQPSGL